MMRERMSRPKLSVPSRCSGPGGSRKSAKLVATGLYGAMTPAKSAARTITMMSTAPAVPSGRRRMKSRTNRANRRRPVSARYRLRATSSASRVIAVIRLARSSVPDPGVEHDVEHVHDEVDEDEDHREQQHQRLDQRVVTVSDRLDEELAEPVEVEDLLGHDEPADEERELERDDRDDREQRVAQRVPDDDEALAYALRPRRAHVILAQHLE